MLEPSESTREAWRKHLAELPPEADRAGSFRQRVIRPAGDGPFHEEAGGVEGGSLPEGWFPPAPIRHLRLLARQRCRIAMLRAQTKDHVNSLPEMHGLCVGRSLFSISCEPRSDPGEMRGTGAHAGKLELRGATRVPEPAFRGVRKPIFSDSTTRKPLRKKPQRRRLKSPGRQIRPG